MLTLSEERKLLKDPQSTGCLVIVKHPHYFNLRQGVAVLFTGEFQVEGLRDTFCWDRLRHGRRKFDLALGKKIGQAIE